jgi:N-methylhydantoinase A
MGSNAGVMSADAARERPVETLLSGPAAGVRGAAHVAGEAGLSDLLTMDMGGTSCDVSLVRDGDPLVSTEVTVGDYPVGLPMVDVHTVGAGGGSIAYLDGGGALRVGPRSAGADPGPICYGRGGTDPTVTDAQFALGRIDPEAFLGDVGGAGERARSALESAVADPLGRDLEGAAAGVLDVANANMARAVRVVSVERGNDPRDFTLIAFGGAGPLHATALAAEVGVPRVLVPRAAGVLSALGLLVSDLTYDESVSRVRAWDELDPDALAGTFDGLEASARDRLGDADVERVEVERTLDVRYAGQSFDLSVPVEALVDPSAVAERFHAAHERRYGHASPAEPLELVTVRVRVNGVVGRPSFGAPAVDGRVADAQREYREVWFDGSVRETPIYRRERLPPGGEFDGPAVVEGSESTLVVRPDDAVTVDEGGNLLVEVGR